MVGLAVSGAGCSADPSVGSPDEQSADVSVAPTSTGGTKARGETGRLIVQQADEGQMDALIEGTVVIEDGCTLLEAFGDRMGLVWPVGTTWSEAEDMVRLSDGTVVRTGDRIRSGGGEQTLADLLAYRDAVLGSDVLTEERTSCAATWWCSVLRSRSSAAEPGSCQDQSKLVGVIE